MICFLEHDSAGNIYHVVRNPNATIVPLINVVEIKDSTGTVIPLADPVGIDEGTYNALIADGLDKYKYDSATGSVVKKEVA